MKNAPVHILSPFAFYSRGLSRAGTVTSFVVAVLPRNVISFNESYDRRAGKFSRLAALSTESASSADNLQKFPLLRERVAFFPLSRGIRSTEFGKSRGIIELTSTESQSNFAKCCSPRCSTLKSLSSKKKKIREE